MHKRIIKVMAGMAAASLLVSCAPQQPQKVIQERRPTEDIVYEAAQTAEAGAYYTGRTIVASLDDIRFGGPQYVAKLFTEGLSRAPSGSEYREYTTIIEEEGCTAEVLTRLAEKFFTCEAYMQQGLTGTSQVYAVYRAILNREPDAREVEKALTMDASALAAQLCGSAEFTQMLPDINKGPYFWGENNMEEFTGGNSITSEELQTMLNENQVVSLPQGTQVMMDSTVFIPEGVILETEGNPTHYANMARLIRTGSSDYHLVILKDNSTMRNIYVEGSLSAIPTEKTLSGSNVLVGGVGGTVERCRISDSVSHQNLWVIDKASDGYLAHNLVTGYASDHNLTWQDGITCLGTNFIIEYNHVVDVTDASIAIFRYVDAQGEDPHAQAQNSIVRFNRMMCLGNSAYVGYDHETGNYHTDSTDGPRHPANMTGLVSYENEIWTSMRAHYHMMVTMSTVPWLTESNCDKTIGGSVYNNYTPDGCYALTGCAIAVDKVTEAAVRGNRFHVYIGEWCRPATGQGARIYSVNEENTTKSDLQPGFVDRSMAPNGAPFICTLAEGLVLESAESVFLKEAVVYEDEQTIPVERFQSETQ